MMRSNDGLSKQILVVDDDESVLSFLSFSLRGEGFAVREARSAEMAIELLKKTTPDLILLDMMLPGMDGLTMCAQLRRDARFSRTPVLIITAYADKSHLGKVAEAGAQGLIEKPVMFSELLVQIRDALCGRFTMPTHLRYAV